MRNKALDILSGRDFSEKSKKTKIEKGYKSTNDLNPFLNNALKDNELSKEEAEVLLDMFNENKANVLLISRTNLKKLRKLFGLKSKRNYLTYRDKKTIAAYIPKSYVEKSRKEKFLNILKYLDKNGYLKGVNRLRLDQIISPYKKIKFSITLSENSIYTSRLDGKTFNVVWGKDKRTGKYTYVFENGPLKRRRVLIGDGDKLGEYIEGSFNSNNIISNRNNYKRNREIIKKTKKVEKNEYKNISERNRSFIDGLKLPRRFKRIALEFASKLRHNEILTKRTPIALVDHTSKIMLYTINGRKIIVPVLLGKNGITRGGYVPGDRKTLAGKIHRFDPSLSRIASTPNGDASNSLHSKTVKSASLQSQLSMSSGGRYFHGVAEYRIRGRNKGMGTWGCIGVDVHTIRKMYYDVKKNGIGYGYVG